MQEDQKRFKMLFYYILLQFVLVMIEIYITFSQITGKDHAHMHVDGKSVES